MRALYAGAVFLSSVLLFLIQPILAKGILPWFGGSASVWTSAMLFFQVVLLAGYLYAHFVATRLRPGVQTAVHVALLGASLAFLPVALADRWKPRGYEDPFWLVLGLLGAAAGLPCLMLSASSPLLQSWYARLAAPYRLYAVSNAASLIALLSYPVLVEPHLTLRAQMLAWSAGYAAFAVACGAAAFGSRPAAHSPSGVPLPGRLLWLALAAVPSALWLSVGHHLSESVAAVPFLWILPLGLYLLSFVLAFAGSRWYPPRLFRWLVPAACAAFAWSVSQSGTLVWLKVEMILLPAALFVCTLFCHGELARRKPEPSKLTAFYLSIAIGGAAGGFFTSFVGPRLFREPMELPVATAACALLAVPLLFGYTSRALLVRLVVVSLAAFAAGAFLRERNAEYRFRGRGFYGSLEVIDTGKGDSAVRSLYNGTILHGAQYLSPESNHLATTYYGPSSGAARAISLRQLAGPVRVGVVGLGPGTLAAYGHRRDVFRFYEINPVVIRLAREQFQYLSETQARIEIIAGDARLSMEREPPQHYSVLALDAFTGDSIPTHLLTRQAFQLYFRHLEPSGILAVHITNKFLDLVPVVRGLASDLGRQVLLIRNGREDRMLISTASWMLLTSDPANVDRLRWCATPLLDTRRVRLWTDDYSNLFQLLK